MVTNKKTGIGLALLWLSYCFWSTERQETTFSIHMLQFNLLRPEWTGIIKQNLSYDGEPVSFVSVVIRLRTEQQENIVRFSTKIFLSLSHFMWANPASCSVNTGSSFLRSKAVRVCSLLSSDTDSFYLQGEEEGGRSALLKWLPCRKLSVPSNTQFHLSSIFKKAGDLPPFL
jgi:hypothetical protein